MVALMWLTIVIVHSIFKAFVVMKLWGWFIVPLGVAPINMWSAMGITLLIGTLVFRRIVGEPNLSELSRMKQFEYVLGACFFDRRRFADRIPD